MTISLPSPAGLVRAFLAPRRPAPRTCGRRGILIVVASVAWLLPLADGAEEFQSTKPIRRVDYWQQRQAEITTELKERKDLSAVRLVFLGASITDFWHIGDSPWATGKKYGRAIWDESFGGCPAENLGLNLGIAGDRTEHVLHRLRPMAEGGQGELDAPGLRPEFVIVQLGTNNTFEPEPPVVESVFAGIRAVVQAVHELEPQATIILQSLLPGPDEVKNNTVVRPVNERMVGFAAEPASSHYLVYLDLHAVFTDSMGRRLKGLFNDNLHPNEAGYRAWRDQLLPCLAQVRRTRMARAVGN